jgi:acetyl esterase/lipase
MLKLRLSLLWGLVGGALLSGCDLTWPRPFDFQCPTAGCANPKGLVIIIHGGGWQDNGLNPVAPDPNFPGAHQTTLDTRERWRARGWATAALSYRPSRQGPASAKFKALTSFLLGRPMTVEEESPVPGSSRFSTADVEEFFVNRAGYLGANHANLAGKPVCVVGYSAGAHLALWLAARHDSIACVVADGAPTDFIHAALDADNLQPGELASLGQFVGPSAQFAFGAPSDPLGLRDPELSPAWLAQQGRYLPEPPSSGAFVPNQHQIILLGTTTAEPMVPSMHANLFKLARPNTEIVTLQHSDNTQHPLFVHDRVTPASFSAYHLEEDALAQRVAP